MRISRWCTRRCSRGNRPRTTLFSDEFFGAAEEHCFDDDAPVVFLVELFLVLLPLGGGVVAKRGEVLLRALADDMREEPPGVLVLREVRLRDELLFGVLELELLALCSREVGLGVPVLSACSLVEPVRAELRATHGRRAQA